MSEAYGSDLRIIPSGILLRQAPIVTPKTRRSIPVEPRCAPRESPLGPAPMITTSVSDTQNLPCRTGEAPISSTCPIPHLRRRPAAPSSNPRDRRDEGGPQVGEIEVVVPVMSKELSDEQSERTRRGHAVG